METHERFVIGIKQRPFTRHAINRIRPIENDDLYARFFAGAHAEIHRPDESVIARPDILEINEQNIEIFQHFRSRLAVFAVQTVNGNVKTRDARNFSIPPCCPASGQETHVAGQKTLRDEKDRHCVARGCCEACSSFAETDAG